MQTLEKQRKVADALHRIARMEAAYSRLREKSEFHWQQNRRYWAASHRVFLLRMNGIASHLNDAQMQRLDYLEARFTAKGEAHWQRHWKSSTAATRVFHLQMYLKYGASFYKERYQAMTGSLPKNVFSRPKNV